MMRVWLFPDMTGDAVAETIERVGADQVMPPASR